MLFLPGASSGKEAFPLRTVLSVPYGLSHTIGFLLHVQSGTLLYSLLSEIVRNSRRFDNKYYQDMIVDYLQKFGKANRADFRKLLLDKFPDELSEKQKERKILTLLTALKRQGVITTDSDNKQISHWILVK
ncbi:hypothetical protein [Hornefia butyriciproducens]|uniref:hypothetical protein n=2 Tax=Hornefia butyriciproducens TaxID=2652293 RepID=UPI003F891E36